MLRGGHTCSAADIVPRTWTFTISRPCDAGFAVLVAVRAPNLRKQSPEKWGSYQQGRAKCSSIHLLCVRLCVSPNKMMNMCVSTCTPSNALGGLGPWSRELSTCVSWFPLSELWPRWKYFGWVKEAGKVRWSCPLTHLGAWERLTCRSPLYPAGGSQRELGVVRGMVAPRNNFTKVAWGSGGLGKVHK